MACCFDCILQSGGGSGLSAQIRALQQSWRANAPADFARVKFWAGAVAVRYAHLAATAINMRTGGGKCAFVGLSECRGRSLYCCSRVGGGERQPVSYPLESIRRKAAFPALPMAFSVRQWSASAVVTFRPSGGFTPPGVVRKQASTDASLVRNL